MNQKISDQHSKLTNQNILFDEIDGKINILNSTFSKKLTKEHLESSQRDQDKIRNILILEYTRDPQTAGSDPRPPLSVLVPLGSFVPRELFGPWIPGVH